MDPERTDMAGETIGRIDRQNRHYRSGWPEIQCR
jgi:hypothetical protein